MPAYRILYIQYLTWDRLKSVFLFSLSHTTHTRALAFLSFSLSLSLSAVGVLRHHFSGCWSHFTNFISVFRRMVWRARKLTAFCASGFVYISFSIDSSTGYGCLLLRHSPSTRERARATTTTTTTKQYEMVSDHRIKFIW